VSADDDLVVDPGALRMRVADVTATENVARLRTLGPLLVLVHIAHVVVFLAFQPLLGEALTSPERAETWRLAVAAAHAAAALFSVLCSVAIWRIGSGMSTLGQLLPLVAGVAYLLLGALLTSIDQLVTNSISAYLTVALGVAMAIRASLTQTLVGYTLAFAALVVGCTLLQLDVPQRLSVTVNGLTATALGVGLALYANRSTRRRTYQRVLIESQRRALTETNARLEDEIKERRRAEAELMHLAMHDVLTGLPNRRAFGPMLERAVRSAREGSPSTLALLDLDHFKTVNDRHGHTQGDEVLRDTARVLRAALRTDDEAARLGGEEFGVILRGTNAADAGTLLERLRREIADQRWDIPDLRVTTSIGYTELLADENVDARSALRRADAALYEAKEHGRDRIVAG
jgi:diguanylate cyclase (GGDEF)-like protein